MPSWVIIHIGEQKSRSNYMILLTLFFIFAALQLADIITTYKVLSSGKGVEANKFMAWAFARFNVLPTMIVLKAFAVALLSVCAYYLPQFYAPVEIPFMVIIGMLDCFYGWIAVNNVKVLKS